MIVMMRRMSNILSRAFYRAIKSALTAFAKGAALDLAGKKIRVNTIAPGTVNTPLIDLANISDEQRIWISSVAEIIRRY